MGYLAQTLRQLGTKAEYAKETVIQAAQPELGRRALAQTEWVPFFIFGNNAQQWGQQRGPGDFPKLLTNQIVIHTTLEIPVETWIRINGDTYRLTNAQQMPYMGETLWAYTLTSEVKGQEGAALNA